MNSKALILALIVAVAVASIPQPQATVVPIHYDEASFEVLDDVYEYQYDEAQDMQLPELPTGCEATACATLARLHGVPLTKKQVADAMPKGEDYVNMFWGDPYSESGWACMPPCAVETLNSLMEGFEAFERKGVALSELELPAVAWVTIGFAEPIASGYEKDGYKLHQNTHAVVVLSVGVDAVEVNDPLSGVYSVYRATFERIYDSMGRLAVIIKEVEEQ